MLNEPAGPRVRMLGPVEVTTSAGERREPGGALVKALLVVLAIVPRRPGVALGVDAIAEELWGDDRPQHERAALQTLVSRLRAALGEDVVVSSPGGYALGATETDLALAEAVARRVGDTFPEAEASSAAGPGEIDPTASSGTLLAELDRALALWRGEPALDLGAAPVAGLLAERAAALRRRLLAARARCRAASGDHTGALADLEPLVSEAPLDEALRRATIESLAASGRRTEALAAFVDLRARLGEELGVSPSAELVELNAHLLREGEAAVDAAAAPRVRIGLRAAPNELIGRDEELVRIERLLDRSRLVTVLGAGGLGKTRMAQAIAARSTAPGVVVVELASVRSDDDVTLALATAVGLRESSASRRLSELPGRADLPSRIVAWFAERPTLLVLDNCEQIVEGVAAWAAELLATVPTISILATSRSPLAIGGEHIFPLGPLAADPAEREPGSTTAPDADGPAVRLFLERAEAARPGLRIDRAVVVRLCERLDGLPLAIELAAARVRSLSVEAIEARLENRFALLTTGDRAAPERHRTLEAVIEWSWALLRPAEQRSLARLAWFPDGFGLDAAARVAGAGDEDAVLAALDGLVMQSLLAVSEHPVTALPRYRMLETVREFGQARLDASGETEDTLAAVRAWASQRALQAFAVGDRESRLARFRGLIAEHDNLVAVLRQAIARPDPDTVFAVFSALAYYWTVRSTHTEVLAFTPAMLEATHGTRPAPALVDAAALGYLLAAVTSLASGSVVGLRALARLRLLLRRARPTEPWIAAIAGLLERGDEAAALARLDAMTASTDPQTALTGLTLRALFAENEGDPETATERATQAYALAVRQGDLWAESMSSTLLAQLGSQGTGPAAALRWAERARVGLELLGAEQDLLQLDWLVASTLLLLGRLDEARVRFEAMTRDDRSTADGLAIATVGELGLVELARIDGRRAEADEHGRRVVASFGLRARRASPWYLMALAALVGGAEHDGRIPAESAEWAALLRRRLIVLRRARPGFVDRPVLGTTAAGWSAWAIRQRGLEARGLELLALAESLNARQDVPAMRIQEHLDDARALLGDGAVDRARATAAALDPEARVRRAHELLAAEVPPPAARSSTNHQPSTHRRPSGPPEPSTEP